MQGCLPMYNWDTKEKKVVDGGVGSVAIFAWLVKGLSRK